MEHWDEAANRARQNRQFRPARQWQGQLGEGLPLRAEINIAGYLARRPGRTEHA
jgi:hypothetical protein